MIHNFNFDGKDSRDYGLYIVGKKNWNKPERDVTSVHVPGRDGDIIIDNGCYKNYNDTITLRLFSKDLTGDCVADFYNALSAVKEWLLVDGQYHKLTESYNPDYYREVRITSFSAQQVDKDIADITINLDCKPYIRRISGDEHIVLSVSVTTTTLKNPEDMASKPYMKLTAASGYDSFVIWVNSVSYVFYNIDGYVEIDSESMNVFKGITNKNNDYAATSFPMFRAGNNKISFTDGISSVDIIPRWRTI